MMRKAVLLFMLAGTLFAADPFVGTWKLNTAKSKHGGGPFPELKEETTVVTLEDGKFTVNLKGATVDGSPISMKYSFPETGGPVNFMEGGPPETLGITSKILNREAGSKQIDSQDSKDGKPYETGRVVVSADGKTLRSVAKGVDAQGKKYENIDVNERQ